MQHLRSTYFSSSVVIPEIHQSFGVGAIFFRIDEFLRELVAKPDVIGTAAPAEVDGALVSGRARVALTHVELALGTGPCHGVHHSCTRD